jgi:hypothetical protein
VSAQWQKILLLGSPSTIMAAKSWREEGIRLAFFARRILDDRVEFQNATRDRREARRSFFSAARADLSVTSGEIPATVEAPADRQDVHSLLEVFTKAALDSPATGRGADGDPRIGGVVPGDLPGDLQL